MSFFERLRSGKPPELALAAVTEALTEAVQVFEHAEIDAALLRAQLADHCRDAGVEPVEPGGFDAAVRDLDGEGWRRLSALIALWPQQAIVTSIALTLRPRGAAPVVGALLGVVRDKPLLTMAVLRMSALRVEELSRAWIAALGIAIAGETAAQSAAALTRLDYARLLAQAEQARKAAEGRMAKLKQAQDEDDQARSPRRGKW